ncbi:hypothetical protein [Aquimarina sp. 2201CG14-23]|uniref:hypothetical protein n=1 Tax=Aquimarina mycalae TaxID=3040073 RepID=UPI002478018D|nr:hypothetical protein [Aquimarina sp. 2201CG14-23]MDH7447634.1 hypothetical protein [Aquimarina sp. 2201CG14-23]
MNKIILILITLISSCTTSVKTEEIKNEQKTQEKFKLAKSDYTILTYTPKWHWTFNNVKPSQLQESELIEIEEVLKSAIQKHNQTQKNQLIEHNKNNSDDPITQTNYEVQLQGYMRQYVPVINNKGQKEVFINFFCDATDEKNWQTQLVQVEDGGNCYYSVKISMETKKYYEFEVNYSL